MKENKTERFKGVYFKSASDVTTQYLVELCEGEYEGNALVKVYTLIDLIDEVAVGTKITWFDYEVEWIAEVNLCGKYFFPKFDNSLQLYYDDKEYYMGKSNTNSITSLMHCINFAIEYGLKESNIKPY